jgi:diamine N-acetyltransferase
MSDPQFVTQISTPDGRVATVRPLQAGDVEPLGTLFLSLSPDTKRVYGPHPFDRPTAEKLCASIDLQKTIRFVAVLNDGQPDEQIVGYMILSRETWPDDSKRLGDKLQGVAYASFAPVLADAFQSQGFGYKMAQHVMASARAWGLQKVVLMGGVRSDNPRAQRLYVKLGFRRVGEFWAGNPPLWNYDMILDL